MIVFNLDLGEDIKIETDDKGGKIRFGENTLGLVPTTDGYSITNDWNNRHFTIGFSPDSVFYHLTREVDGDKEAGRGMSRSEYMAEMFGYLRYIATPRPEESLEIELVGAIDIDAARQYLKNEGVIERVNGVLSVNNAELVDYRERIRSDLSMIGELCSAVLDPVPVDEMRESGEIAFIYPGLKGFKIIILYPNREVGVADGTDLWDFPVDGGGSPIIDHLFRSITTE